MKHLISYLPDHLPSHIKSISSHKGIIFLGIGIFALATFTACEPHPASQTVPGWEQKQVAKEKVQEQEKKAEKTNKDAPSFFPQDK